MNMLDTTRIKAALVVLYVLCSFYVGNILMATLITPLTHIGTAALMPQHLWLAFVGSALIAFGPSLWLYISPLCVWARHLAAIAIGLECSLATALSGGQIELHFTFFVAMVFLALLLDVKTLWTFTGVVLVDHIIRGWYFPNSVYGCSMWKNGRPPLWLALEHAGFVLMNLVALRLFIQHREAGLQNQEKSEQARRHLESKKTKEIVTQLNQDLLERYENLRQQGRRANEAAKLIADNAKIAVEKVADALKDAL